MDVRMTSRIITKNHAADSKIGSLLKIDFRADWTREFNPTAWELRRGKKRIWPVEAVVPFYGDSMGQTLDLAKFCVLIGHSKIMTHHDWVSVKRPTGPLSNFVYTITKSKLVNFIKFSKPFNKNFLKIWNSLHCIAKNAK